MARVTRSPPKPKPRFVHEVRVGHEAAEQAWLWENVERIAGPRGFKKRTPFWAYTIVAFTTKEQAAELELVVRRHREAEDRRIARQWPCPVRTRYEEAAAAQHAIIWGLSTGLLRDVVRVYRRERRDCSTHGSPNWIASDVILAAAPGFGRDRAREMVDAMLAWVIARHGTRFWTGLSGDKAINRS